MTFPPPLGPVMFDLAGSSLTAEEAGRLKHPAAGGIILFSRNYESPRQLLQLIESIRSIRPEILIAVDHEGGRVQRFRAEFTAIPPAACYRRCRSDLGSFAAAAAEVAGWLMAAELRSFGIDFSFAPVLDVDSNVSQVIGDRSFSDEPEEVTLLAAAFHSGMRRAGMSGVGKHFPGHGSVAEDSHRALPVDGRRWDEIRQRDLEPFRVLIEAGLEGIMPAHVLYPVCDGLPAGYSPFWIGEILRRRLHFRGAVFSDDLSMGGAEFAGDFCSRARTALCAGSDMVLVCNSPDQVDAVLESVAGSYDPGIPTRLAAMRGKFPVDRDTLLSSRAWKEAVEAVTQLTGSVA